MSDEPRRKLIEVALPLEVINRESAREKSIRHGHPSTLHLWWSRKPLATCRAVLFASLVDDPSSRPDLYSDEEADAERERLFRLVERLVAWEATTDEQLLKEVREEIRRSTDGKAPPVLDPFCGGGSIPLEAQRLGLEAHASDLNPVAVLITKALIEIPPKFKDMPPINQEMQERLGDGAWKGAHGLAEDVRYYGRWMREEARKRIGHLYPQVKLSDGREAPVIAWIWARTVKCSNPACGAQMPLTSKWALSTKSGNEWHIEPIVHRSSKRVDFDVREGPTSRTGTIGRRGATCAVCNTSVPFDHIRAEGRAGRMGTRLMAIVAQHERSRVFLPPDPEHERLAMSVEPPAGAPETDLSTHPQYMGTPRYGLTRHRDLFTLRQLVALTTFSDLVPEARKRIIRDQDDSAYADAVATYLGLAVGRFSDISNALCSWENTKTQVRHLFTRQAIPMAWDFAEPNIFAGAAGDFAVSLTNLCKAVDAVPASAAGYALQRDATAALDDVESRMVCTDPPYYDNIPYGDLSDFFYVWLRRALTPVHPDLFSTVLTPKGQELIADTFRFDGSRDAARDYFERGMAHFFARMLETAHRDYPTTLFYAFKQAETRGGATASTGWETMLTGLLDAGFSITGTWPMRSELSNRMRNLGSNALASSIVLVCRPRPETASLATRREFTAALRSELPEALRRLQSGSIAPVDLAQAAIGPGMAVFSRYSKVIEADGNQMRVRTALELINEALDELLAEQEADFDPDTRWCVAWFEQYGMDEGPFGVAETLSRAKNTAINGLVDAGVVHSRAGKVRLLDRGELEETWDPATDARLTVWEVTQHLIARHQAGGEEAAADLLRQVGSGLAEEGRELAYRLFAMCERKDWAREALGYNALVAAWPEITRLAAREPEVGAAGDQETMGV